MVVSDNTMVALSQSVLKLYRKDTTLFPNLQAFSGIFYSSFASEGID